MNTTLQEYMAVDASIEYEKTHGIVCSLLIAPPTFDPIYLSCAVVRTGKCLEPRLCVLHLDFYIDAQRNRALRALSGLEIRG